MRLEVIRQLINNKFINAETVTPQIMGKVHYCLCDINGVLKVSPISLPLYLTKNKVTTGKLKNDILN